jgi:hypothetical protein
MHAGIQGIFHPGNDGSPKKEAQIRGNPPANS